MRSCLNPLLSEQWHWNVRLGAESRFWSPGPPSIWMRLWRNTKVILTIFTTSHCISSLRPSKWGLIRGSLGLHDHLFSETRGKFVQTCASVCFQMLNVPVWTDGEASQTGLSSDRIAQTFDNYLQISQQRRADSTIVLSSALKTLPLGKYLTKLYEIKGPVYLLSLQWRLPQKTRAPDWSWWFQFHNFRILETRVTGETANGIGRAGTELITALRRAPSQKVKSENEAALIVQRPNKVK